MMRGMFAAISGLKNHQVMLDVTANDIANVNTIGYKSARTSFKDALNQTTRGAAGTGGGMGGSNAQQIGLGVTLGSIDNLMQSGSLQPTGNPLDVGITGPGFFRVNTSTANPPTADATGVEYTRAGNFTTNEDGYLITQDGYYVQGQNAAGQPSLLQIPTDATNVAISGTGEMTYVDGTGARVSGGFLTLATFPNSSGLERSGNNRWTESPNSGAATVATPNPTVGTTTSGVVEMSNVDLAQTFTNMITAQRGFQANSRVISTADEMLQDLVNLKR
jgi:flagellar hook protein FlgE